MKTSPELSDTLNALIQSHYYSEDFELLSALQAFVAGLDDQEQSLLAGLAFQRITADCSLVDIMLCGVVNVEAAAPVLADKLNRASAADQVTRALIAALQHYPTDEAYRAVERFLDSDQELEALQALARMDFARTLSALVRVMRKEHARTVILHILYGRVKTAGLDALIRDIAQSTATRSETFREDLLKTLHAKSAGFNPFDADQLRQLTEALPTK